MLYEHKTNLKKSLKHLKKKYIIKFQFKIHTCAKNYIKNILKKVQIHLMNLIKGIFPSIYLPEKIIYLKQIF